MDRPDASPTERADTASELLPRPSYKSFRRKYRKIMVQFEDKMRESNTLFREHQRIADISRRLSEQNDQLLELLFDLNRSPHVPPAQQYSLSPAATTEHPHNDGEANAYAFGPPETLLDDPQPFRGSRGDRFLKNEFHHMDESLHEIRDLRPMKSYASLSTLAYAPLDTGKAQKDAPEIVPGGFLAPDEEERYIEGLDSYLNGVSQTPRPFATTAGRAGERTLEKDREVALKNPVSVYNWLRKHQPQVFLQDNEAHSEKNTARTASSRTSKRASTVKQEPELYDEDGIAIEPGPSAKGKRKRDDDGGYRPKGGNGRPVKRKKEDSSSTVKKSKKSSSG